MTTAALNRSAIMSAAWEVVNGYRSRGFVNGAKELRLMLSRELRKAWAAAKSAAFRAMKAEEHMTPAQEATEALSMLENKDRWSDADRAEAERLRREIHAERAADYAEKRELIASAGGRICAVTFTKVDGSERTMKVQPAALKFRVKGEKACASAKQAAATRAERHPNLLNVWDVEAKAPRSINLATIKTIALDGMAYAY